jgi:UDP-2,3-diacylglucosamine pyrophosphatase LpxH
MDTSALKLKLVVSDFHLGSGHRTRDGSLNILEDFFHDREFIDFLQYFATGDYEQADVELILNGDFFNLLMIDFEEIDPEVVTELTALRRMTAIIDGHRAVMNALRFFASQPNKSVCFVMGNHDPGILFPSVQLLIREAVGDRCKMIIDHYEFDGIYVEHGNQYEVANSFDRKKYFLKDGLPEPVLNQPWGTYFLVHVVNHIKRGRRHFDKVLPFGVYLKWLMVMDPRFLMKVVGRALKFFAIARFKRDPRRNTSLRKTLEIMLEAPLFPDLDDAAARILHTRENVHTVIFGHNHRPAFKQMGERRFYINTGTWNEMTHLELDRLGTRLECTFALIEYKEDRAEASLKIWHGRPKLFTQTDVA